MITNGIAGEDIKAGQMVMWGSNGLLYMFRFGINNVRIQIAAEALKFGDEITIGDDGLVRKAQVDADTPILLPSRDPQA